MEKINIAELLKDCPKGMELDCTMFDNLFLSNVNKNDSYPIMCYTICDGIRNGVVFTEFGEFNRFLSSKCVIFPKGKTTWEGFQKPFKDGDILINGLEDWEYNPFIFKQTNGVGNAQCYCAINCFEKLILNSDNWTPIKGCRLATEEEKEKLFNAIRANGYKWNPESKTLEKLPKFKVGDKITKIDGSRKGEIYYIDIDKYHVAVSNNIGIDVFFEDQDDWELIPNKFDISALKPFESRVLVRSDKSAIWKPAIYGIYKDSLYWMVGGSAWIQCIPYSGNEHLFGTTDDCDEFYKNW